MDIKNLSELAKIINLCRKKGIESVTITKDSIEMRFTESSSLVSRETKKKKLIPEAIEQAPPKEPSELDMLLWSADNTMVDEAGGN